MPARAPSSRRSRRSPRRLALLCALVFAAPSALYLAGGGFANEAGATVLAEAPPAGTAVAWADIRVTDGDTFRIREERIRIANIDTPEMPGRARCDAEAELALAARARLGRLLAAGDIRLAREGVDRYGRTLARVRAGGVDVGDQLVRERLAQRWMGRKASWC